MIKNIKRAGIFTLTLAIFSLALISILCGIGVFEGKTKNCDSTTNNVVINDTEFVPDITLSGTAAEMATKWAEAVALHNDGTEVKVLLGANWTAPNTDIARPFGTGTGFSSAGAIYIPQGVNIKLDLAGKTINRGLSKDTALIGGEVINVDGTLTIIDSVYDSSIIQDIYDNNKQLKDMLNSKIDLISIGKISGGATLNAGGGIFVNENATFNMYGGMVSENFAKTRGAGISSYKSTCNLNGGIVYNNFSNVDGGGIYAIAGTFNMTNFYLISNQSGGFGGGISMKGVSEGGEDFFVEANIQNCISTNNHSLYGGGISCQTLVNINLENTEASYNYTYGNSGGLLFWDYSVSAIVKNVKVYNNTSAMFSFGVNGGAGIICKGEIEFDGLEVVDNRLINYTDYKTMRGAGIYITTENKTKPMNITFKNTLVSRNVVESEIDHSLESLGGGMAIFENVINVNFGENVQIFDNEAQCISSDLRLEIGQKINIIENLGKSRIGVKLANNYGDNTFTTGFIASGNNNQNCFFSNNGLEYNSNGVIVPNGKAEVATISNGEVVFEKTISSDVYDFIYLENGKRFSYSESGLIHAVNDYDKSLSVNNNMLILGNILPNTSVNEFIGNIKFSGACLKLLHNDIVIYDSINKNDGNLFNNGEELAVGTGWKLQTYSSSGNLIEEFYLSVLGDLTGDGKVNSADVNFLRQMVANKSIYNSFNDKTYIQLATLIMNKGSLTSNDADILWSVVCGTNKMEYYI